MEKAQELNRGDFLARERTSLANERTFLAYVRTALSLIVLGIVLIHFSQVPSTVLMGVFASAAGITILLFGLWRFFQKRVRIETY